MTTLKLIESDRVREAGTIATDAPHCSLVVLGTGTVAYFLIGSHTGHINIRL